jgi:cell division transport system permease protein
MRPGFFFREALRSLRRNAVPSFAAVATVLVTMLVLGVFIPIVQATTGAADEVRSRVMLDVYIKRSAKPADIKRVRAELLATPNVKTVDFIPREEAYRRERSRNPEAYALLGTNPLPDAYRIIPDDPGDIPAISQALTRQTPSGRTVPIDAAIDEVKQRKEDTKKILTVTGMIKVTMGVLAGLLALASVLLIANTIRLSLFARRREVEVMKLVGATDWFIRWPFMLEGVIVGALGAGLAVLVLAVGKIAFIDPLRADLALISAPHTISFGVLVAVLMVASVIVSALGTGVSLRRFLRV